MSRLPFLLEDLTKAIAGASGAGPVEATLTLDDQAYDAVAGDLANHFGKQYGFSGPLIVGGITIVRGLDGSGRPANRPGAGQADEGVQDQKSGTCSKPKYPGQDTRSKKTAETRFNESQETFRMHVNIVHEGADSDGCGACSLVPITGANSDRKTNL